MFERALDAGAALGVVAALVVRDVQAAATKIRRERRRARLGHADDDDGEADAGFERGGGIAAAEARGGGDAARGASLRGGPERPREESPEAGIAPGGARDRRHGNVEAAMMAAAHSTFGSKSRC